MTKTLTASIALAQNNYTTADLSAINTEYIIDDAIDFINHMAGTSIPNLSGAIAGSKTVSLTYSQNATLAPLISCMLRDAKKTALSNSTSTGSSSNTAKSVGVGNVSVSESGSVSSAISAATSLNSADDFTRNLFNMALKRLIGCGFRRS